MLNVSCCSVAKFYIPIVDVCSGLEVQAKKYPQTTAESLANPGIQVLKSLKTDILINVYPDKAGPKAL